MRQFLAVNLLAVLLCGCSTTPAPMPRRTAGEPYYFTTAITQRGYRPSGEITKAEAEDIAERGSYYWIVYFNSFGKPNRFLKMHNGKITVDQEIKYDADGNEIGIGPNRAEQAE